MGLARVLSKSWSYNSSDRSVLDFRLAAYLTQLFCTYDDTKWDSTKALAILEAISSKEKGMSVALNSNSGPLNLVSSCIG